MYYFVVVNTLTYTEINTHYNEYATQKKSPQVSCPLRAALAVERPFCI